MQHTEYKNIFKTTFLFSFVRVFQIITAIVRNKVIVILLGADGLGIIGILTNTIQLIQSGSGLGISKSAVRDISQANRQNNKVKFSFIISLTNNIILFTCLLGIFITIIFAPLLSNWTFGNNSYTIAYIWISLVVGLNILTEGQLAILKGMRKLRALAKASMIGSIVGLLTALPLYYFLGTGGIVPSLIISAISAVFFSNLYVRKISYDKTKIPFKQIRKEASPMVKMGVALMLVSFLGLLFDLVIAAYIRSQSGLGEVGYYRAGTTIITSYFGIILTAMTTDYYPRISSVHNDNPRIQDELNRQAEVGLVLIFPIAVLFVFLSPLFIQVLYSKEFIQSISYTDYAIIGTILTVGSNSMGMILLAKQEAKIFMTYSFLHRALFIPIYFIFYLTYGIMGLGISYLLNTAVQFLVYYVIVSKRYNIIFQKRLIFISIGFCITLLITILSRNIENSIIRYTCGIIIFMCSLFYLKNTVKRKMKMDILKSLKEFKKIKVMCLL